MATTYRFLLADAQSNNIGELHRAGDRSLSYTLNGIDTASCTVPISDKLARRLSDPELEHMLKVYAQFDDGTSRIVFHGPVLDAETNFGPGGSVRINAASPFWRLTKRLTGTQNEGRKFPTPGVTYDNNICSRSVAASELIAEANVDGNTGIIAGYNPAITDAYASEFQKFRNVGEWVTEIASGGAIGGGFDFIIVPQEKDGTGYIGYFRAGAPAEQPDKIDPRLIGRQLNYACSFEMGAGTRNNLIAVRQPVTREGLANQVWHIAPYEGTYPRMDNRGPSIAAHGLCEAILTEDILDEALRDQLIDLHLDVRKNPRRILDITPANEDGTGRVPALWQDYEIGDQVSLRVVEWGDVVIDALVRIYSIGIAIDDNGTPTHTLTITPEGQ